VPVTVQGAKLVYPLPTTIRKIDKHVVQFADPVKVHRKLSFDFMPIQKNRNQTRFSHPESEFISDAHIAGKLNTHSRSLITKTPTCSTIVQLAGCRGITNPSMYFEIWIFYNPVLGG